MNIKLTLQYDGTNYHGWQIQKNGITVQQTVKDAVFAVTREETDINGCGRTDAGVHAERYVCNFHTSSTIPPERFAYALNTRLPDDVVCVKSEGVSDDFYANWNAKKKCYVYKILNSPLPDAFMRRYAWHCKYPLDIDKMRHEAKAFLGEHDFIGFAASGFTVKTTVRTIYALDISKDGNLITISVTGNGFLYNMVRIIAGTLVQAGSGKLSNLEEIIASRDRKRAGITAPACGLYLKEVFYDE